MLHRVLRAHGCALSPRECAAFEAAVWGVVRGIVGMASLDVAAAEEEFGVGSGPPVAARLLGPSEDGA
eukprot:1186284-Alexandrium_andersonii.AAC.1